MPEPDRHSAGDGRTTPDGPAEEYFARIEEHFGRRRGGPLVLSPKDWQLIERWHRDGVPLTVVLRGINRAFDRFEAGGSSRPDRINSLRYCEQHVAEALLEHREARAGERQAHDGDPMDEAARHLGAAADACRAAAAEATVAGTGDALQDAAVALDALVEEAGSLRPRDVDRRAREIEERLDAALGATGDRSGAGAPRQRLGLGPFSPYAV